MDKDKAEHVGAVPSTADAAVPSEGVSTHLHQAFVQEDVTWKEEMTWVVCQQGLLDLTGDREFLVEETARAHLSPLFDNGAGHWKVLIFSPAHFWKVTGAP